jgi:hypothetical protein
MGTEVTETKKMFKGTQELGPIVVSSGKVWLYLFGRDGKIKCIAILLL